MSAEVTGLAEAAIGRQAPDDWILDPESHASSLPAEAGALARVLRQPQIADIISAYRTSDSAALKAQKKYKRLASIAITGNAAAAVFSAFYLLPVALVWSLLAARSHALAAIPFAKLHTLSAYLDFAIIAVSVLAARAVAWTGTFDIWMKERAKAEIARIALFETVAAAEEPSGAGELPLLPLLLEYFRRYQLEVEVAYYRGRGMQHDRADKARATRRALYTTLGSIGVPASCVLIARQLGVAIPVVQNVFLFFGVLASTLLLAQGSLSLLSQDRRNASRYLQTADNLEYLEEHHLEAAREAAASGDRAGVQAFISAVDNQISSEHREWISFKERETVPALKAIAARALPGLPSG